MSLVLISDFESLHYTCVCKPKPVSASLYVCLMLLTSVSRGLHLSLAAWICLPKFLSVFTSSVSCSPQLSLIAFICTYKPSYVNSPQPFQYCRTSSGSHLSTSLSTAFNTLQQLPVVFIWAVKRRWAVGGGTQRPWHVIEPIKTGTPRTGA